MKNSPAPVVAALGIAFLMGCSLSASSAEKAHVVPAPVMDPASTATSEVAVLAGGCFWGVQGVYQHVKGVTRAVSGYAGGEKKTAEYEVVGSGATGHAESVQITYDPRVISYAHLLQIFFSVAHDPTELNRQGPDEGTQYRSSIFYATPDQKTVAEAYIRQLDAAKIFRHPIVTTVVPLQGFYAAEAYHQHFLEHNQSLPYIVYNDLPKLDHLKKEFPELLAKR